MLCDVVAKGTSTGMPHETYMCVMLMLMVMVTVMVMVMFMFMFMFTLMLTLMLTFMLTRVLTLILYTFVMKDSASRCWSHPQGSQVCGC